ncbi:MAG: transcriptional repressor [Clostridia bacterium]|nr:transcriptional repressor [Clostridia bacterium]
MTKQKRVILDVLRSTTSHPTADWIYNEAKKILPNLSLGTVYRNLNNLKEEGKILELSYGSTYSRFDGNPENHYHCVCVECGKVADLDMPVVEELDKKAQEAQGSSIFYHRLEFYGLCPHCEEKEMKN